MESSVTNNILNAHLKAEALSADLLQNGHAIEQLVIDCMGDFKKMFSDDIEALEIDSESAKEEIKISLNRDGIYDLLPEGLFHQSRGMEVVKTTKDAVLEHRIYKEEERAARMFFSPLEQMIFEYATHAEVEDRQIRYNMNKGRFNDAFCKFWGINIELPEAYRNRMLELMPFLPLIKCDRSATTICLQYILQCNVVSKEQNMPMHQLQSKTNTDLCLGMNTQLGDCYNEYFLHWTFCIYCNSTNQLEKYTDNKSLGKLLQRFIEIFVPFYIDVEFEFIMEDDFTTNEHQYVLGYGAILQS